MTEPKVSNDYYKKFFAKFVSLRWLRKIFAPLILMHGENGEFINRTVSSDLRKCEICAAVSQPGLFAVAAAPLEPTAGEVVAAGRVGGRKGVIGAMVYLTDGNGQTRAARTNAYGYFRFETATAGESYIVSVGHKRYQFTTQYLNVVEDVTDLVFEPIE